MLLYWASDLRISLKLISEKRKVPISCKIDLKWKNSFCTNSVLIKTIGSIVQAPHLLVHSWKRNFGFPCILMQISQGLYFLLVICWNREIHSSISFICLVWKSAFRLNVQSLHNGESPMWILEFCLWGVAVDAPIDLPLCKLCLA